MTRSPPQTGTVAPPTATAFLATAATTVFSATGGYAVAFYRRDEAAPEAANGAMLAMTQLEQRWAPATAQARYAAREAAGFPPIAALA